MEIVEGVPRQLLASFAPGLTFDHMLEGFQYTDSWSHDGRFLLTQVQHYEGGLYALWAVDSGVGMSIDDSFSYAGDQSEVFWASYSNRLLHLRSGSFAYLDLIEPTRPLDALRLFELHAEDPSSAALLGVAERPDSSLVYGLHHVLPLRYESLAFFRVTPGEREAQRIAGIPDSPEEAVVDGRLSCRLMFTKDASQFLCLGNDQRRPRYIVGDVEAGTLWDATFLFRHPDRGHVNAIAFGSR
jgi:hypothetical protein